MFTGITEEIGIVSAVEGKNLTVRTAKVIKGVEPGASMAVNGVCLTITALTALTFSVDVMPETLRRTNLGTLQPGSRVNLERPLKFGGEMGGHLVQGHVDGTGTVLSLSPEGNALLMRFRAPPEVLRYCVPKGFIAVDGVSLTIVDLDAESFLVSIVGYTRTHTILGEKQPGDAVNLETDIMAKYAERLARPARPAITAEFLRDHGFMVN